jgi:TRAP-type C4-dicarboxylate transport system permease small subunit
MKTGAKVLLSLTILVMLAYLFVISWMYLELQSEVEKIRGKVPDQLFLFMKDYVYDFFRRSFGFFILPICAGIALLSIVLLLGDKLTQAIEKLLNRLSYKEIKREKSAEGEFKKILTLRNITILLASGGYSFC